MYANVCIFYFLKGSVLAVYFRVSALDAEGQPLDAEACGLASDDSQCTEDGDEAGLVYSMESILWTKTLVPKKYFLTFSI